MDSGKEKRVVLRKIQLQSRNCVALINEMRMNEKEGLFDLFVDNFCSAFLGNFLRIFVKIERWWNPRWSFHIYIYISMTQI